MLALLGCGKRFMGSAQRYIASTYFKVSAQVAVVIFTAGAKRLLLLIEDGLPTCRCGVCFL